MSQHTYLGFDQPKNMAESQSCYAKDSLCKKCICLSKDSPYGPFHRN